MWYSKVFAFVGILQLSLCQNKYNGQKYKYPNGTSPINRPQKTTLQELLQKYNYIGFGGETSTQLPARRRSSRSVPESCFTLEDINTLVADMKDVASFQFTPGQPTVVAAIEPVDVTDATECEQARDNVWTQFHRLAQLHLLLIQEAPKLSKKELEELKHQYEIGKEKYQNATSILKPQLSDEAQKKFIEMEEHQQTMERKLKNALKNIECLAIKHLKNLVHLCASQIDSGRIEDAAKKFEEINDQDQLYAIILKAYRPDKVENIVKFIEELPWLSHRAYGYDALLIQIEKRNDLNNPHLLTVHHYLLKDMASSNIESVLRESKPLLLKSKRKMEKLIERAVGSFANAIQMGNYQPVLEFSNNSFTKDVFSHHLKHIVRSAYPFSENSNIIQLAESLNNKEFAARVYIELYKQMQEDEQLEFDDTLKLALRVKVLLRRAELRGLLLKFSYNMPPSIRALTWGKACIQHYKDRDLFLCADESDEGSPLKRKVMMCDKRYGWIFDGQNDGEYFHLRPEVDLDSYLFVDKKEHVAYTGEPHYSGSSKNWTIIDTDWENGVFKIRNPMLKEYLTYLDDFSDTPVQTDSNPNHLENSKWIISVC